MKSIPEPAAADVRSSSGDLADYTWDEVDRIVQLWQVRPCFLCGVQGQCKHREFTVDLAEVRAAFRRIPVKREHALTRSARRSA
jgi:hypothetical protein